MYLDVTRVDAAITHKGTTNIEVLLKFIWFFTNLFETEFLFHSISFFVVAVGRSSEASAA